MTIILGLVAAALIAGAIVYLGYKLTVATLKSYKMKKTSKIMAAQVKDLIKKAPTMKLDDLDDDDIILAEYDPEEDELVQDIAVADDVDVKVSSLVDSNDGIVVFE